MRTKHITTSSVKRFLECRQRYFFEYVEKLKPKVTPEPLRLGSAYHTGVEAVLTGKEIDIDPLSEIMVGAFRASGVWKEWEIISVEKEFKTHIGYAKYLVGKVDGYIKYQGIPMILEHKTATNPDDAYFHHLLWDLQAANYLMAFPETEGMMYCVIEKPTIKPCKATPPDKRKYKKDGTLYANQREIDETEEEYLARIKDWYRYQDRIHTHFVYRNENQLETNRRQLVAMFDDLNHCKDFYPMPDLMKCKRCPFQGLCLEDTPEGRKNFITKEKKHEELAIF